MRKLIVGHGQSGLGLIAQPAAVSGRRVFSSFPDNPGYSNPSADPVPRPRFDGPAPLRIRFTYSDKVYVNPGGGTINVYNAITWNP